MDLSEDFILVIVCLDVDGGFMMGCDVIVMFLEDDYEML